MPVTIVAGAQWGDEGKGRIVDLLANESDMVVRCQGGRNAGHTIVNDLGKFILHTVPSGIFNPKAICIVGAGTVVDPVGLMTELKELAEAGIDIDRVIVSDRAHLIMPYHRLTDRLDEARRRNGAIGTTGHGIGWAYADKAARCGYQVGELQDLGGLRKRLLEELPWKNKLLELYGHAPLTVEGIMSEIEEAALFILPYIGDTVVPIMESIAAGQEILLEGQLGVMRDLDFGAYPFVTSSCPTPAGMCAGAGISPVYVDRIIGIMKAYTSAVGAGPFPTELFGEEGDALREKGGEYGATTGRPRRCGWLDTAAVSWAAQVAGFTEIAITKIDILDGIDEIPICVEYTMDGKVIQSFPSTGPMQRVQPVYQKMPGWTQETSSAREMSELPSEAVRYIDAVEELIRVPITMVSVGPERDAIIHRYSNY